MELPSAGRPYRSHKHPACQVCRQRKIRCHVDGPNQPCKFCEERGLHCGGQSSQPPSGRAAASTPSRRRNHTSKTATRTRDLFLSPQELSTMIVDPTMAEDINALERYMTIGQPDAGNEIYSRVSHRTGESIMYSKLPDRRPRLQTAGKIPGAAQREIMQQVLHSCEQQVVDLYFEKIHPCFPILDAPTFKELYSKDADRISPTLICQMYAISLCFWSSSPALRHHQCPCVGFAWNQGVAALNEDFASPSMTSICSSLLVISGRPVNQVSTNICTVGRIVTLAHSLGLHRSPTAWQIPESEMALRINLWWGVLIHDYWSSFAHGTPTNINKDNFDVPLPPEVMMATSSESALGDTASVAFHYLCRLTQILGDVLPMVYRLKKDYDDMWRQLRRIECSLDDWEEELSTRLQSSSAEQNTNGLGSLRFCFLEVKLLICRLAFQITAHTQSKIILQAADYRRLLLNEAATSVATHVINLQTCHLEEFWLSYTAQLLVSSTIVLLRCTVESKDDEHKQIGTKTLMALMDRLKIASETSDWDLADFCVERCQEPVRKIAASLGVQSGSVFDQHHQSDHVPLHGLDGVSDGVLNEHHSGMDPNIPLDFSYDSWARGDPLSSTLDVSWILDT